MFFLTLQPAGENTFEWGCIYYNGENSVRATVKIEFPDQQTYDQFSTAMADVSAKVAKFQVTA